VKSWRNSLKKFLTNPHNPINSGWNVSTKFNKSTVINNSSFNFSQISPEKSRFSKNFDNFSSYSPEKLGFLKNFDTKIWDTS